MSRSLRSRWILCAAAAFIAAQARAQIQYTDFSAAPDLTLNGGASLNTNPVDGPVLRVASNAEGQAGSAFTNATYNSAGGFSTFFTFRLSAFDTNGFYGADGLLFVLQADPRGAAALGVGGGTLGYGDPDHTPGLSIQNSLAVEFDTYDNDENHDPNSNHLAIDLNGSVTHSTTPGDATFPTPAPDNLRNEHLWYTWIDYDGTTLDVRMSLDGTRPGTPSLSRTILLDPLAYHVGFTAGTGSGTENHDVLNWSFNDSNSSYGSVSPFLAAHSQGGYLHDNPGPASAEWSQTASWQELAVPTNATNVTLGTANVPYTLHITTPAVAQTLFIDGSESAPITLAIHDAGTLNVASDLYVNTSGASGATITIDGVGSQLNVVGFTYLSSGSTSAPSFVSIKNGGALNDFDVHVSGDPAGTASVSVDGPDSTWDTRYNLLVGEYGASGSITLTNAAYAYDKNAFVGNGGTGSAIVDHSTWHSDDTLVVGNNGLGSLVATNGALIQAYDVRIAQGASGYVTPSNLDLDGPDSHLNVSADVTVATSGGNGKLRVTNGANLSSTNLFIGGDQDPANTDPGSLADDAASFGTALFDDAGLDNSAGVTHVGYNGYGDLTLHNAAHAVSGAVFIGENTSAQGNATVAGSGTTWQIIGTLAVGGSDTAPGGIGRLAIADGATVTVAGTTQIYPTGTIDIQTGGTLILASPADAVRQYLHDDLLTSTSADATHRLAYTFSGEPTAPTSLIVQLTLTGDANLDGVLDADDYALIDRAFAKSLPDAHWTDGDFNYDGTIDQNDYLLLDTTYGQAQGFSPGFLSIRKAQFGDAYVQSLLAAVPEPSSLTCLLATLPLFTRRSRQFRLHK